jgi:hypothetical protein
MPLFHVADRLQVNRGAGSVEIAGGDLRVARELASCTSRFSSSPTGGKNTATSPSRRVGEQQGDGRRTGEQDAAREFQSEELADRGERSHGFVHCGRPGVFCAIVRML